MSQRPVAVGLIGGGLMGKELSSALARWQALQDHPARPVLTHVCDADDNVLRWFERVASVRVTAADYRVLLDDPSVDVVYIAVPHHLHERVYLDAVDAGKSFLGEKPFGIDLAAASRIVSTIAAHPGVFARCSSEMPFYPAMQAAYRISADGRLGRMVEAGCGLLHSSDLDLDKPINWKRRTETCGAGGVMADLGMHSTHLPLRLGWNPALVYGVLQDLVADRPAAAEASERVPCDTFENASLLCRVDDRFGGQFPMTLEQKRIAPGQMNTFYFTAIGLEGGVRVSTRHPKTLEVLEVEGGSQSWKLVETGSQSVFPTITGSIFEFGFTDAILQMWASFLAEWMGELDGRFGCATPEEALATQCIFEAALRSNESGRAVDPANVGTGRPPSG